ncbi:pseudouridine synthase [Methylibium sp.]|uniref:pseudouridine synthase n=1 Tax=Methylibium sp. TaxID=2067992 RepID=UPI003D12A1C8
MNSNDTPSSEPQPGVAPVSVDDKPSAEATAPVKRRTRKPAAPAAESGVAAETTSAEAEPEPPKAPRRRKPKADTAVAVSADGDMPLPTADKPPAPHPVDVTPAAAAGPAPDATEGGTASEGPESAEGTGAAAEDSGERSRRSRNRRRGRKDRAGRDGVEAVDGEGGAEEGAERAPRPAVDPALAVERFAEVLSGAYDAEAPEPDDEASVEQSTKRVLRPEPEAPKLHKVLAQSGIGSRRDMEQFILDGKVTVNDHVAHVGMRISFGDRIAVDGKPVRLRIQPGPARLLAYHKPTGEVVTLNDPEGRPTVFRRLPRLQQGKWQSVGRLDINTEGLLLFTNSGELANQLMHPRFGVEREYAVRVLGSLDEEQRAKLLEGVEIDGQTAGFKSIEEGGGEGANRWYRVVITEGRNREVRKLFDKVGLAVSRLIRIRYGTVVLPRGLKRGVWVELDDQDLRAIRQLASGGRAPASGEVRENQGNREQRRNGRNGKPDRGGRPPQQSGPSRQGQGERGPRREPREPREPRAFEPALDAEGQPGEDFARIPNPLEQTFDRRFAKGPRRGGAQGFGQGGSQPDPDIGGPPGTIPNPLEQTFDKRFVKGSQRINAGFGRHDAHQPDQGGSKKGGPKQPDPMQTSVGYIGADAYFNKAGGKRGGGRGGPGGRGGSSGGGGGGAGRGPRR